MNINMNMSININMNMRCFMFPKRSLTFFEIAWDLGRAGRGVTVSVTLTFSVTN